MIDFWGTRHSNPYNSSGFTLVEIMIIVIVLGILVAIVLTADSAMLARSRDAERVSDVTALSKEFEQFYRTNINESGSSYPRGSNQYNDHTTIRLPYVRGSLYKYINADITKAPGQKDSSIIVADDKGLQYPSKDKYVYQPFDKGDNICREINERCVRFKFYYQLELEKTPRVIDSMRQQ